MSDWLRKNNNRIFFGGRTYQFRAGQPLVIDGSTHYIEGHKGATIENDVLLVRFTEDVHKRDSNNVVLSQYAFYKKGSAYKLQDVLIEMGMDRILSVIHNREYSIDKLFE
jgi:hypothetical protein